MELQHTFDVPVPPERAFEVLRDIERIGPCMPGASIDEVDGDHFKGRVKVKIGPIQVTYRGEADYVDVDPEGMSATINARGRESRGSGTANAVVRAHLTAKGDGGATVNVVTELNITGKPAQFGRGVMADVGEKLIGRFADCLAGELARDVAEEDDGAVEADMVATGADGPGDAGAAPDDAAAARQSAEASTGADSAAGSEADSAVASNGAGPASAVASATGASSSEAPREPAPARSTPRRQPAAEPEALDLLEMAGAPVAQRAVPALVGVAVLYLLYRLLRRR